jgi:hypothetical protein
MTDAFVRVVVRVVKVVVGSVGGEPQQTMIAGGRTGLVVCALPKNNRRHGQVEGRLACRGSCQHPWY